MVRLGALELLSTKEDHAQNSSGLLYASNNLILLIVLCVLNVIIVVIEWNKDLDWDVCRRQLI